MLLIPGVGLVAADDMLLLAGSVVEAEVPPLVTLTVADALHAHSADAVVLVQSHVLAIAGTTHAHGAESVALVQAHMLSVADARHGHTVGSTALVQSHLLAIADAFHAHSADGVVLVVLDPVDRWHGVCAIGLPSRERSIGPNNRTVH